jgi:hypothetical protein
MFLRKNHFSALFLPLLLSGLLQGCGANDDRGAITVDLGIPVRKDAMASIMPRIMSALSLNIGSECYQDQIYLGMRDTTTKEVLLMKKVPLRSKIITSAGITYDATSNDIEQVILYLKYNTELDEALTIPAPRNSQVEVGVFGQFFKPEDNNKDGICDQHSQDINQINNKWVTLEEMVQAPRYLHTSSVLPDGSIYVVGGKSSYGTTDSTLEQTLYRPGTGGAWQNKSTLNTKRFRHTMTLTRSGKLVVIGGISNWTTDNSHTEPISLSNGIEILDTKSANSSWETKLIPNDLGYFTNAPYLHTATLLPDDRILIIGGNDATSSKTSVSIYDPEKNSWENADDLPFARQHHATVVVGNQVMVVGGENSLNSTGDNSNVFITRIGEWSWSSYSSQQLGAKRVSFTANAFKNDSVVVIGGTTSTGTALNVRIKTDGSSETFLQLTPTLSNHNTHVLSDDRIVVFGADSSGISKTFVYDPNASSLSWKPITAMTIGRSGMTSHVIKNDRIIAIGGYTGSTPITSKTVEAFIPYSPAIRSTALMGSGMIDNNAIFNREVRININLLHSTPTQNYDGTTAGSISISNSPSKNKWIEIKPYLGGSYSITSYLSSINYFKMGGEYLVKVPTRINYSSSGYSQKNIYIPSMDDMELVFDIQLSGCNGICAKYSVTVQENSLNASSGTWGSFSISPKLIDSPANPSVNSTSIYGTLEFKRP